VSATTVVSALSCAKVLAVILLLLHWGSDIASYQKSGENIKNWRSGFGQAPRRLLEWLRVFR